MAPPVISFNYARASYGRCREVMRTSLLVSAVFMLAGIVCFVGFPQELMSLFSKSEEVHAIGTVVFPIIGTGLYLHFMKRYKNLP